MYALICRTPDEAHCLAVSVNESALVASLKAEAKNYLDETMTDEDEEELGYTDTIAKASTYWSDEDDEYPYELYIEQIDWI